MKFLSAALALLLPVVAQGVVETEVDFSETKFDYNTPISGTDPCVLVSYVMDESGSMDAEQLWIQTQASQAIRDNLVSKGYSHVFFCSHGYGSVSDYRFHGCEAVTSWNGAGVLDIFASWIHEGKYEDAYRAIKLSVEDLPATIGGVNIHDTCGYFAKNMILVTDEDRDDCTSSLLTQEEKDACTEITDTDVISYLNPPYDYILNPVVPVHIKVDGVNQIGARWGTTSSTTCTSNCEGEYFGQSASDPTKAEIYDTTTAPLDLLENAEVSLLNLLENKSVEQFAHLLDGTQGAIWDIYELREGGDRALAFQDAFIKVKVMEMAIPEFGTLPPTSDTIEISGTKGDPHFKTWAGEHYEYHGQCDMVLAKDPHFADGLGLDIHIRTKLVRYWSYIKTAVIRIGTDILEVRGSEDVDDWESHYWINFEYQGELTEVGGFPVTNTAPASAYKRTYEIDLSSKYPGQSIVIQAYKEFVRVDVKNACEKAFGKTVGMLGEFSTGKTFARDGTTVLDDFTELGNEWQVLPAEPKLFHEIEAPQFPNKCIDPEDPRGERRRRLAESTVSEDQAEAACASLKDPLDRKDCIYDVLATQDLDMVGAF